jgi:hypothetical protein
MGNGRQLVLHKSLSPQRLLAKDPIGGMRKREMAQRVAGDLQGDAKVS